MSEPPAQQDGGPDEVPGAGPDEAPGTGPVSTPGAGPATGPQEGVRTSPVTVTPDAVSPTRKQRLAPWRRLLLAEVVLVLAVSLGQSAVYSVLRIIERLTRNVALNQQTSSLNTAAAPDRPWLSAIYQATDTLFLFAPAALALFLLHAVARPSAGVRTVTGLDARHWRSDLPQGLALFAVIGVPGLGLYVASRALGLNTTVQAANLGEYWWTVPLLVAAALGNAVLEEVVMVGYLFTRFRQMAWAPWVVLLASALVRGSYHLYQGFGGFVGNLLMGLILGLWFLRTRRLWPLVVAHFLLDVASFVGYSLLAGRVSWL